VTNFLEEIVRKKKIEVETAKKKLSLSELKNIVDGLRPRNDFRSGVTRKKDGPLSVIAEFKRASPSKGVIAENADPAAIGRDYEKGGASAISVLTEKNYFKGTVEDLQCIHDAVSSVPILRKDFIVDEYQIYESVRMGADAILLIVTALAESELKKFAALAKDLSLSSLIEVHSEEELGIALAAGGEIIGVNNRNLITFEVSNAVSEQLAKKIPDEIVSISESGIRDMSGLQAALESGYHAVLIGEHFMRAEKRADEVRRFASYRMEKSARRMARM